jgi:hypothetical protein
VGSTPSTATKFIMNKYCPEYDTFYNEKGEWTENKCRDPECEYCKDRPETHNECKECNYK